MINNYTYNKKSVAFELLYCNVWGTIYHATKRQCDNSPTITGDGSHINVKNASKYRWIAISQDMLKSVNRLKLLKNPLTSKIYKGKIVYGDTVWIKSGNPKINGWWVVHDAKSAKCDNSGNLLYSKSIDFLQTEGDINLYNGNPLWSGKFCDIKIYRLKNVYYKNIKRFVI